MKKLVLLVALLLASITLQAGELKFGWNLANEAGGILDMKFASNQDQFLVLAGLGDEGVLQLRNTETGELIKSTPLPFVSYAKFEFTPDSTKIILTNGKYGDICLYNLKDLSLIKKYDLKRDTVMSLWFSNIAVDPIRPYVYVTLYANSGFPDYLIKGQVSVYNYETMEFVNDLTTYDNTSYDCLAISKDGKYLAAMNKGKTYLKVWDLSTFELKSDFCLYDKNLQFDYSCTPTDIKFSELKTENIYFCGEFPRYENDNALYGSSVFSIENNKILDSSFAVKPNQIYPGRLFKYVNDEKFLYTNSMFVSIVNFKLKKVEFQHKINWHEAGTWGKVIYSEKNDVFIGWSGEYFSSGKYDSNSSINDSILITSNIIYPNPTNGSVSIKFKCNEIENYYEIYDSNHYCPK